jgi:hypothetical protein
MQMTHGHVRIDNLIIGGVPFGVLSNTKKRNLVMLHGIDLYRFLGSVNEGGHYYIMEYQGTKVKTKNPNFFGVAF